MIRELNQRLLAEFARRLNKWVPIPQEPEEITVELLFLRFIELMREEKTFSGRPSNVYPRIENICDVLVREGLLTASTDCDKFLQNMEEKVRRFCADVEQGLIALDELTTREQKALTVFCRHYGSERVEAYFQSRFRIAVPLRGRRKLWTDYQGRSEG